MLRILKFVKHREQDVQIFTFVEEFGRERFTQAEFV